MTQNTLLVTVDPAWPPISGAELRNWENARAAAASGGVTLASVARLRRPGSPDDPRIRTVSLSEEEPESVYPRPPGGSHIGLTLPPEAGGALARLVADGRYSAAIITTPALEPLARVVRPHVPRLILDFHNIDFDLQRQLRPWLWWVLPWNRGRLAKTLAAERAAAALADEVWVCSEFDARRLERVVGVESPIRVVPNVAPPADDGPSSTRRPGGDAGPTLLFQGHLSYRPNVEAVRFLAGKVFPLVRREFPAARLVLAGRSPHRHVAAQEGNGVTLVADPADLGPIFRTVDFVVLPIRAGSGTRIKVLEAMAWKVPVIASARAVEGLEVTDGVDVRLAERPAEFATQIVDLWRHPDAYERQSLAARRLVDERYDRGTLGRIVGASIGARST